jgi:hypothetical protein
MAPAPTADGLARLLQAVVDEPSFLKFLDALSRDFAESKKSDHGVEAMRYAAASPSAWENVTLDVFLEAATAWAADSNVSGPSATNAWRRAADILMAGKIYE